MKDFTVKVYIKLLETLRNGGFFFQMFEEFIQMPEKKVVVLRHDVDKLPLNSLRFAEIEHNMGIKATYYFRMTKGVYDEEVIKRISELGHEVGYHYECLSQAIINLKWKNIKEKPPRTLNKNEERKEKKKIHDIHELTRKGNDVRCRPSAMNSEQGTVNSEKERLLEVGIRDFEENLQRLRKIVPINTIAMHGSPLISIDNKMLWGKYDYRDYGIIGEPYFDVDYNKILYLTDTGRGWNNRDASVRDKVDGSLTLDVKSTFDLIKAIENGLPAEQTIINTHPQRWNDGWYDWGKELVMQTIKNKVKRRMVRKRRLVK